MRLARLAAAAALIAVAGCAATKPVKAPPPGPPAPPPVVPGAGIPPLPAGHSRHLATLSRPGVAARFEPPASGPVVRRTPTGMAWTAPSPRTLLTLEPAARFLAPDSSIVVDSVVLWRFRAAERDLREPALLRAAALRAADGDTLGADALLADSALTASVWSWEALRARERLALAARDTVRADTLIARAVPRFWPEGDVAAWTAERARLAAARRDTTRALALAREGIRRFPALPGGASALRLLDTLTVARGDSLGYADALAAADVDAFRGAPLAAARRIARVRGGAEGTDRVRLPLRMAELQRRGRAWGDALASVSAAGAFATDSTWRSRVLIERARVHAAASRPDSALALWARAAALAPDRTLREAALWERAREFQDQNRTADAVKAFDRVTELGGRRAADARFLAGLMAYAGGDTGAALARWRDLDHEGARFWSGVLLRRHRDPRGDSLLAVVAAQPGYGFYAVAARDTLGRRGLPDSVAVADWDRSRVVARRIERLAALGLDEEALFLAGRWAARDARLPIAAEPALASDGLAAAEAAWRAGRPARVVAYGQRAQRESETMPDAAQWALAPWTFPPAWDSVVTAVSDSLHLDPALLRATMRQESVFDPAARSSSNALGLMQLLLPAAQDAARWGGEPKPTSEAPLLDPVTNLKWGARYLARLIARFDGHVPVALSAYNAGASTVPPFWRDLIARGGEALFCEVASNPDAQDYAKKILGYRAGYRELAPHVVR